MHQVSQLNLRDIQAFVTVAELGSIGRAAIKLGLTQPAITRRIQSFEDALGNPVLFDRTVKPALLTGAGMRVVEHCRRVLVELEMLSQAASDDSDPVGTLKIGVAYGLEEVLLSSALQKLGADFRRLRLQVSSGWTTELFDSTRAGALDCAVALLSTTHVFPADLTATPVAEESIVVVSSQLPSRKENGAAWHLEDLSDRDWVLNPAGCGCRKALCDAFERRGLPMSVGAEVHGEQLQLSLLVRTGGVGIVPRRQLLRSEFRNNLNVVELEDFRLPATIALIRKRHGGRYGPIVDRLGAELSEHA
jgi:DNA-binding transcriptional LysR family regulator